MLALERVDLPEKSRLRIRIEVVKPSGILDIAEEFRKKINLEGRFIYSKK